MHSWVDKGQTSYTATYTSVNCASAKEVIIKNCLALIPVVVRASNGNACRTYALIDDGADKTLCDERLLRQLNVESRKITFTMSTASATDILQHGHEVDLEVSPLTGGSPVGLGTFGL
ncbi:hypothetical protein DPMN_146293 [Dreissena polymorpha]|uniref:Uncharacterized protein n=1 Tax=Dreissena polymorpha TaxID=45954 RepID=A0A9D4F7M2_DREPO|nr:hypothetical protein DPMN_146293 [Dreissena polymorpha]